MSIKAIPTRYKGYHFRSRLEARWAVVLDSMGVPYEYEKEGYKLSTGDCYLPDFWLPDQSLWMEVKGSTVTPSESELTRRLALDSGFRVWTVVGQIPCFEDDRYPPESGYIDHPDGGWDCNYWLCECHMCRAVGVEYWGRGARIPCGCDHSNHGNGDKCYGYDTIRMKIAYAAGRSARFEHGECGKT